MKHLRTLCLAVFAAFAFALSAVAESVPYSHDFNAKGLTGWTTVDHNGDGKTWSYSRFLKSLMLSYVREADDDLVSPTLTLKANQSYKVTFEFGAGTDQLEYGSISLLALSNGNETSVKEITLDENIVPNTRTAEEATFVAPADGDYQFAIRFKAKSSDFLQANVYTFAIEEGASTEPTEPTEQAVVPPYAIDFTKDGDVEGWSAVDNNKDSNSWQHNVDDKHPGVSIPETVSDNDDDYQSPLFTLEADKSYKVKLTYRAFKAAPGKGEGHLYLYLLSEDGSKSANCSNNENGLQTPTVVFDTYDDKVDSLVFLLPYGYESGNYRLALRYVSTNHTMNFGVKNFSIAPESLQIPITTAEGWGTYYAPQAYTMPNGLKGTIVTGYKEESAAGGTLDTHWTFTPGSVVPKGTALLLQRTDGKGEGTVEAQLAVDYGTEVPDGNLLHGADALQDGLTYVAPANGGVVKYYILSYEAGTETADVPGRNLGFYWATDDGSAVQYQSPFAFLALEFPNEAAAAAFKGFAFDPHTTGITTVVNGQANQPAAIYTLTGRRVNAASVNGLDKGIYIVNGKKVLVK